MKRIQKLRRDLMKKYDFVEFNLIAHGNAKKVKNFKREWKLTLAGVKDEFDNVRCNISKVIYLYYVKSCTIFLTIKNIDITSVLRH